MCARWKRWLTAGVAVALADAAILLAASVVLEATRQVHASVTSLVGAMMNQVTAVVPVGVVAGLGAILGVLGAGWWQQQLLGPAWSSDSGAGLPALGGILAAPMYTLLRRSAHSEPTAPEEIAGSPPHRIYVPRAKDVPSILAVPTGIQKPLRDRA